MRDGFRLFASSTAVIVLGLGLALKADRYRPAKAPDFKNFETMIETRLRAKGWRNVASPPDVTETAYRRLTFRHPSCPLALNLLVLGYTSDLAPLLRARFADDVALVQDGRRVEAFDARSLQIQNLWNTLRRSLSFTADVTPPLIALTPTSETIARACPETPQPLAARLLGVGKPAMTRRKTPDQA